MLYDRFTNKAKEVLNLAVEVAGEFEHGYVGTEHILIGILHEGTSVAATVLQNHGVEEERVVELVGQLIAPVNQVQTAEPEGYTPVSYTHLDVYKRQGSRLAER